MPITYIMESFEGAISATSRTYSEGKPVGVILVHVSPSTERKTAPIPSSFPRQATIKPESDKTKSV